MKKIHYFTVFAFIITCISGMSLQAQEKGVLILAHGGGEQWNELVMKAAEPLKNEYEVEFAFGMANYVTLHKGLKALEAQGVKQTAVVQLFISSHSPIIEQNAYLLGVRDSLPEHPMPLMHHVDEYKKMMGIKDEGKGQHHSSGGHSAGGSHHQMYMPENLQPISVDMEIFLTPALDDHAVVAQILHNRIQELSSNPAEETVVLVAHGPNREKHNKLWVSNMESLIQKIQAGQSKQGEAYKQLFALTVRDDAPEAIFNQAKENLRTIVRQADMYGDVIVVPLYLSSGGREQAVAERLEDLNYKWNGKTLLPDPLITDFIQQSVEKAFSTSH